MNYRAGEFPRRQQRWQDPGSVARVLRQAAELKSFSRRSFLIGAGASTALAADMLFTRQVQAERRTTKILPVGDDFAESYYPNSSWILFPGYKTSWEEAQWILNSLRGSLRQRGQMAAVGYSNLGLEVAEVVDAVLAYVNERKLNTLYFYGHSFGGMLATEVAARLRERNVAVKLILLDSSPFSKYDILDQSWFDGVVFLYESGFQVPSVLRGGYELGERVVNKNERTWGQIWNQTLEQLSPIAPSSVLIQSESDYIYHFDGTRFVDGLGDTRMAFIGNPNDDTVNYGTARAAWAKAFPLNIASTGRRTDGARPAHASPQWNPFTYNPIIEDLENELFPLPRAGSRVVFY
ncbi:thioesterase domain-containing protein [Arthrobacter sp. FW306-2-2C-D06B]|uniref:thioesterase domain-containing protein n=1 Tax=Arthrobacter sp. FW306-2-2C-D06B TaxID=2879618 RepID=UPI001F24B211|nr:thioesterase domain-containing protein [Arthrobacter sp. FW306-2-2C-D06B]UKA59096.1 alpha/beta fold hydrolase [Arthrobacter sp. FW306-2-2C-D06B]